MGAWLRFFFGWRDPLSRKGYALTGVALMGLKYGVEAALVYATTGRVWSPAAFATPLLTVRGAYFGAVASSWVAWAFALWTLPFLWIGLAMSVRRARTALGRPALGLLFLVPFLNYLVMVALCVLPPTTSAAVAPPPARERSRLASAAVGMIAGLAYGCAVGLLLVYAKGAYGAGLFVGTPVLMGAISAYLYNRRAPQSAGATTLVALLTVGLGATSLPLFGLEGIVCIAMALPPAVIGGLLGAWIGRVLAMTTLSGPTTAALLVILPAMSPLEPVRDVSEREVVSSVVVDASPEVVWRHVVSFSELPPPTEWIFKAGVACPMRATLSGEGVGAIRHCDFTTGPFVEPITRWEPPRRLSFDVAASPRPMNETSPWGDIDAPHLHGYFRSVRGEFRLVDLGDGRTRLEGSTWYALDLAPRAYWRLWSDALVHTIHLRVLEHVRQLSETDGAIHLIEN